MPHFVRLGSPSALSIRNALAVGVAIAAIGLIQQAEAKIIKFDASGSVDTEPYGINAKGWITGSYLDVNEKWHGFLRAPGGTITSFDVRSDKCGTYAWSISSGNLVL